MIEESWMVLVSMVSKRGLIFNAYFAQLSRQTNS